MDILQWVFMIGISLTIISVIFTLYSLFSFISLGEKLKKISSQTIKSKRKKKRLLTKMDQVTLLKKRAMRNIILFLLLSFGLAGGSYYVTYYQSTNLSVEDTQNITDGFYYIRDFQEELKAIQNGTVKEEASSQTITFIATSLAGYSVKDANTLNTVDGQKVLNRYYKSMSELGINTSRQSSGIYSNPDVVTELLEDIDKVLTYQDKAFKFFKVDKSVLQAEK